MKIKIILTSEEVGLAIRSLIGDMVSGDLRSIGAIVAHDTAEQRYKNAKHYKLEVEADIGPGAFEVLSVEEALDSTAALRAETEEERRAIIERWLEDRLNIPWLRAAVDRAGQPYTSEGDYPLSDNPWGPGPRPDGWQFGGGPDDG